MQDPFTPSEYRELPVLETQDLAHRLEAALPQTQCTRCGYADCAGYALALARGEARLNQCPPGGAQGITRLAAILRQEPVALDPHFGTEAPRSVVVIDEDWCIGCTLCIQACPVDAILGANKLMHTVIPEHCTGCELCIPVCPVDCMVAVNASAGATGWAAWSDVQAQQARERYRQRQQRLEREQRDEQSRPALPSPSPDPCVATDTSDTPETRPAPRLDRQAAIAQALARARAQRNPG